MKPFIASLANALFLIILGLWGYFASQSPSFTALIPVIAGAVLLGLNNGLRKENKIVSHIAVVLTLLLLVALIKPLTGALGRSDAGAIMRVVVMMASTLWAVIVFVKSFIENRRQTTGNGRQD